MKINKKLMWSVAILAIILLLQGTKKEIFPAALGGIIGGGALPTLGLGATAAGAAATASGVGAPIGVPLMVIGIIILVIGFIGFQWLTDNFVLILGAIIVIAMINAIKNKGR